jgi:rfaE bifunctional protein kinase chain/domain
MQPTPSIRVLLETLEKFSKMRVLVIGDVIIDRYIWGAVNRISPEAPVPIVSVHRTQDSLGGAANALRNLRNLGAHVTLCGVVGADKESEVVFQLLGDVGVQKDSLLVDPKTPTIVKTRIMAASQHHHSQQLVRVDREDPKSQTPGLRDTLAEYIRAQIDQHDLVIVSDYGKGTVVPKILTILAEARKENRLGLNSRPYVVDPHPLNTPYYDGITTGTPNRHEAEASSGVPIRDIPSAYAAARVLRKLWKSEMMAVTLGEEGLVIVGPSEDDAVHLETTAKEVYDVSGAGDCVTALIGLSLAAGASPSVAGQLANLAAGIVISEMGTVAIDHEKLVQRIEGLGTTGL